AVERKLQQPAHEGSQQPSLGGIAYEDVAHAGHGVHASGGPGKARSNRAVHSTLDGEAVDDVGALAAEEANEANEQADFAQRVQAPPIHGYRLPLQPKIEQAGPIRPMWRDKQDIMARALQGKRKRATEIEEVPVCVGVEDDLHRSLSARLHALPATAGTGRSRSWPAARPGAPGPRR